MAALCVWLAPTWLTVTLTSLVAVGMVVGWIVEDVKASGEPAGPA